MRGETLDLDTSLIQDPVLSDQLADRCGQVQTGADRCGQVRAGADNPGFRLSLLVGGHLADNWRTLGGHGDNWRTLGDNC